MRGLDIVIVIWTVLAIIIGLILRFVLKKTGRKLDKYAMIYKLLVLVITFLVSALVYYLSSAKSLELVWTTRLSVLVLGAINVFVLYKRPWTKRDKFVYEEDALWPECLFVLLSALLSAVMFVTAPKIIGLVEYGKDISKYLWDLPIVFLLSFLIFKLTDRAGQIPFKVVENPWLFKIEKVDASNWKKVNLMQVNFEVKKSLQEDHHILSWTAATYQEAPKGIPLGKVFRYHIQQRRKRKDVVTIQDMGDYYDGTPEFCWIFSIKRQVLRPSTWFRKPRHLNPSMSIEQNKIVDGDVIVAQRIPGDGTNAAFDYEALPNDDPNKTILINR